jgi:SAM-dependent methyltransferase
MDRATERIMSPEPHPACRSCGSSDLEPFLDLGATPLADALVSSDMLGVEEARYPLEIAFCPDCTLVQILEEVPAEKLFVDNYLYFSSFSDALLDHSRAHAEGLIRTRDLSDSSLVVELASNDGYLLRNFVDHGVPVLGIDPAPGQAAAANAAGVPTLAEFFGIEMAQRMVAEGTKADVIIANNVLAHVPDLNGFVAGMATLLADDGLITVENPYVRELIDHCEFDTIYHEHFCYYSCTSIDRLMRRHGLWLNDVEFFPNLHGGTLRWHIGHHDERTDRARKYLADEADSGMGHIDYYSAFSDRVAGVTQRLHELLTELNSQGALVAGYGAAAKGSTLLNTVGIGTDLVEFVVDRNVHKQGNFMPGTNQPIIDPEALVDRQPDYVLLLAWNFASEIIEQQQEYLAAGGRFIVPVPEPVVVGE